ncbi:MAG: FkbM family methyltransferase [Bacteroidales bacterium]
MLKEKTRNFIIHSLKYILSKEYRELSRIRQLPRYSSFKTKILGNELMGVDGASFVFTYNEIFKKCIYNFRAANNSPLIIDCGANIGLSIIYFKSLYPDSNIIAFEPDQNIFKTLSSNISSFNLKNVTLLNNAVWIEETTLDFSSEGADGGRISTLAGDKTNNKINALRLKDLLKNKKVDFLKIDIEGAETIVLKDCEDVLHNVEHLFVEYHSFENKQQTLHELLAILHNANFRIHALPVNHSPHPFIKRNSYLGIDLQFNIFAFRE